MSQARRRIRLAAPWLVGIVGVLAGLAPATAGVPLDDGPHGMTCHYQVAAANLPWQRQGGDWQDADGVPHGERPFATAQAASARGQQRLQWDVTTLGRAWLGGQAPAGAVLLRAAGGNAGGIVNLRSREHADTLDRPQLDIEWDDGRRDRVGASADTYFACPTYKSSGGGRIVKVGGGHAAALVFELPLRPGRDIRRATLGLTADKVYGAGLSIGAFQILLPSSTPGAVRTGLAKGYRNDVGLEQHPDVLWMDRFDERRPSDGWSGAGMSGEHLVDDDAANRFEAFDGRALKVTIERGVNQGLNSHHRFAREGRAEPEEAFFRYYLRFGDTWDPVRDGGKLPGLSGTYGRGGWGMRKSDGVNGWSARGAFFQQASEGPALSALRGIGSYAYHADLAGPSGATLGWGLGPSGLLQKNRWYSVEQQVKLNRPGASDGELRAWIDGQLVFEKTGLRFRDVPEIKIESVWMNVYHGGTAKAPADMTLFIDNVVIARRYIGPVGSTR